MIEAKAVSAMLAEKRMGGRMVVIQCTARPVYGKRKFAFERPIRCRPLLVGIVHLPVRQFWLPAGELIYWQSCCSHW